MKYYLVCERYEVNLLIDRYSQRFEIWICGHSSAGRAPAWHAGGQRFESAWLHLFLQLYQGFWRTFL